MIVIFPPSITEERRHNSEEILNSIRRVNELIASNRESDAAGQRQLGQSSGKNARSNDFHSRSNSQKIDQFSSPRQQDNQTMQRFSNHSLCGTCVKRLDKDTF